VAIDERRRTFVPTLWNNLAELNDLAAQDENAMVRPFRQEWMPGDHGSVGGGGDIVGLSNLALLWICEGAAEAGLWIDPVALARFEKDADWRAPLGNSSVRRAGIGQKLTHLVPKDRDGPVDLADIHIATRMRWHAKGLTAAYRPGPLARLAAALDAAPPEVP
jgi:uncharacterized protein (DUF2235 family)